MSHQDEREMEASVKRALDDWQRLDDILYNPDLPRGLKLRLLSHLRTRNRKTGLSWAGHSLHALAMSSRDARVSMTAEAELAKLGVFSVSKRPGYSSVVTVRMSKVEEIRAATRKVLAERRVKWQTPAPSDDDQPLVPDQLVRPDVGVGRDVLLGAERVPPLVPDVGGPLVPGRPYPMKDPLNKSTDEEAGRLGVATKANVDLADPSKTASTTQAAVAAATSDDARKSDLAARIKAFMGSPDVRAAYAAMGRAAKQGATLDQIEDVISDFERGKAKAGDMTLTSAVVAWSAKRDPDMAAENCRVRRAAGAQPQATANGLRIAAAIREVKRYD